MAAGTAVVASDIEGYRSAAGGAALLVPPGDAAALRGSIVALLDGEVQRSSLVAAGRRRAVECSIDTVAARYAERYRHLAGTSRSR
jgi:glycosyltransferase involved in cell wall biosynthesis